MKPFRKIRELDKLETHDRLLEFNKQADYISQGCQQCIENRPQEFANHPFYIFAHKREIGLDERYSLFTQDIQRAIVDFTHARRFATLEDVPTARFIWMPRLTKPKAQSNSMLFKNYPPTDTIKVIWILPAEELWGQYTKGTMTENKAIYDSICKFKSDKRILEEPEDDDLDDAEINSIYNAISKKTKKRLVNESF
jgi:hypothetical protein